MNVQFVSVVSAMQKHLLLNDDLGFCISKEFGDKQEDPLILPVTHYQTLKSGIPPPIAAH